MMSDLDTLANGLNLTDAQKEQLNANVRTLQSNKLLATDADIVYAKKGSRMTTAGLNVLAKTVAGATLEFTRVDLGDSVWWSTGNIATPSDEFILGFSKTIHPRYSVPVAKDNIWYNGNGTVTVKVKFNNSKITEGFHVREVGLFAKDPDTGKEILYSYKNFGVLSSYVPAYDGATAEVITINLITVIDQTSTVTAVIDESTVSVTQTEFAEHVDATNPHPNFIKKGNTVSTSNAFWAAGTDNNLHLISKDNMQTQLLGSSIYELPHLDSRINQTEINIANLFMELNTLKENGLEANLMLAEDFSEGKFCDFTKIKVIDQVAGADNVCVETLDGILVGHYYEISDGMRYQYVRVRGIAKNATGDGALVVFFDSPITRTYNLAKTYLYRSTVPIVETGLDATENLKEKVVKVNETYGGVQSGREYTLMAPFATESSNHFELSGDWAFTDDGKFTLA